MLLSGKTALVTGGSRGIGAAIVRRFRAEGARVAFTYARSAELAEALCAELGPDDTRAFRSDAASFAEAEQLVADATEALGPLHAVVNNAGITRDNLLLRMSEEQWDEVVRVNLKSVFNLTKHAMRGMMRQRAGSIINVSSVVGDFGNAGQANYAASKAGIFGFTKSIAKEVGSRGIRCNAVAPGFIATEMTDALDDKTKQGFLDAIPMRRLGTPEEVADVCVFLASDLSTYVNGQTVSVCGALNT